jgi:capsular polysaccharide transport system permease protein
MMFNEAATLGDSRRSFADRLYDHVCLVGALAHREIQSRFGQNALGYAWTYVVPLLWIGGTYFFFTYVGRKSPVYTDLITFIISGLIPFLAFRLVISSMGRVNGSVRGVVIFPTVTREHAAVAMALVELANTFIVFTVVAVLNLALFGNGELDNALKFAAGVALAWGLGAAYGYFFSTLALFDVTFQHVSGPLLRPAIFLSGIFFVANELPENVLRIFALNPILHAVEFARDGMLFHYQSRVADPFYVLFWIAGMFAAALIIRLVKRA